MPRRRDERDTPTRRRERRPRRDAPVAAFALTGVVSTVVLLATALFINTQDSLFFAIFAASSVVFLMPYLLMFPAAVVLRRKDPDRERPFRVPGGMPGLIAVTAITTVIIAGGIVLFVWPEIPHAPEEWDYTGPLLGVVVAALAVGEAIIWRIFHPHEPGKGILHRGHPHARPHLRHGSSAGTQPAAGGR